MHCALFLEIFCIFHKHLVHERFFVFQKTFDVIQGIFWPLLKFL